jgi:molybdopterin synthase sulfur carrier subunit
MAITVKFIGALRHLSGAEKLSLRCKEGTSIKDIITELTKKHPELKRSLIDLQQEDPKPNALILVNDREISVLNGLDTELKNGDEVVFVPVVHGG